MSPIHMSKVALDHVGVFRLSTKMIVVVGLILNNEKVRGIV